MDLSTEPGTLPTHTTVGRPEPSPPSSARCQTESGGTILLQLLEFKTRLLEVVEELHIRRDAETRFEDQISTLVLEKQELEWEKESLQHQAETMSKQHTESLTSVKKQFQAKIRNIEEEKGKYQVSAELKDKEINNLKEELKALQLLKYNLEKKSSELEQKLALQSRSKDSHLNQLGEVEKRFGALSRQCAAVKQAHEKLEQNVDEAIKRNTKLTSANGKQEAALVSLKKELEEVSNKLIKAKMSSVSRDKTHSPAGGEQRVQQLQHKLSVETEMNKKLREENVSIRAEKQEVMRSLQHTQQLLLSQTQTVSRAELELQTQREQHEALKQEHEAMREKSTATEDKVAQLMESYAASKTSWDKEKAEFLGHIRSVQHDLRAVSEAHDELHHKHTKLSSQAEVQTQHTHEQETRDGVSARLVPALLEEIREEETLNEPVSSSQPPGFDDGLRRLASAQTEKPDRLEDAGAATKLVATGSTGGRDTSDHRQQSQFKHPVNPSNVLPSTCTDSSRHRLCALSRTTGNKQIINSNMSQNDPDVAPRLIHAASSVCDDSLPISKGSCVTDASSSSPGHRSVGGSVESKEKKDDMKRGENEREEEEMNVRGEDAKEGESAQTTDRADRREDAGDTKEPGTETKDRAERPHTPETQISAQTTADTATKKSSTQPVIDFMDADSPLTVCEPSDCSQSLSERVCEKVSDCNHVNEVNTFCSGERQSVCQTFEFHQEKRSDTSAANIPTELSEPLNQSSIRSSQTDTAAQSDNVVTIQELETKITRTQPSNPSEHEPQASPQSPEISELEPDATMDTVHLESKVETGSCQEHVMKEDKVEDAQTIQTDVRPSNKKDAPTEAGSTKCHKQCQVKEMLHGDTNESSPPGSKTFRSSFDWATVPTISEQHLSAPSSAIPSFLKRKHNKVPSVISRASDLLNASSRRHRQQGEQTATAAADVESRTSPSVSSFPVSTSSSVTVSRLSWQTTAGCSRALSSESDWEPSFSQEREEEQSSFRAQISKIEQFLNMEKLRLPKRPRTDD
ncbi:coiled-coil domain-containing protein 73 isoform X2 [Larimichthys crocea]|uniref:coiled-coil domain-containing protein 73 isoform X2 n=1 Tax=Larimichthys crocea TaxID=215358 RepID=UPI000F5E0A64|nr:coiled-coil domain-containing protein 73 isoform X2 [Larimichthys crocea]